MRPNRPQRKPLFIFWLWLLAVGFVYADDFFQVKEQIIRSSWFKMFSFYISPGLSLTNTGYTSNIYSYQDRAAPDWTADVGINLTAASILKNRLILIVTEYPYYSFYAKNKKEEAFNNKFEFAAYTHVGRFNINYRLNLNNTRERPNYEFGARTRRKERRHGVNIHYGDHDHFFITMYAGQGQSAYTDERYLQDYNLSLLDREEFNLGITLNKRIFSRTRISLRCEYYDYRFKYAPQRDGTGRKLSVGIDFPQISSITGALNIGWNAFFVKNPGFSNFAKPFGSGSLNIRVLRRFKCHFSYLVDSFFSFCDVNQYFAERSAAAGVDFYLSRRLKIGYEYCAGNLIYQNLVNGIQTRRDDFSSVNFSLGVRIFRKMGIALTYTFYRMNSTQIDFKRRYHFIGGAIVHEF